MRTLIALCLALLLVAALACNGDDQSSPQQIQQTQQSEQTEQSEQDQAEPQSTTPASSEQSTAAADTAEQSDDQASDADATVSVSRETDPLLAEAVDTHRAWVDSLTSFEMTVETQLNAGGPVTDVASEIAFQRQPFKVLTTIDYTPFAELAGGLNGLEFDDDEPLVMRVLLEADAAYLSFPGLPGWVDLSDDLGATLDELSVLLGGNPSDLANPEQLTEQAFGCVDAVGGSVVETEIDGEAVWLIECDIDVEQLTDAAASQLRAQGMETDGVGIETMRISLAIAKNTGAALLIESVVTIEDLFGLSADSDDQGDQEDQQQLFISSVSRLVSWNQPVAFPTPEPLVDGSMFDATATNGSGSGASDGASFSSDGGEPLSDPAVLLDQAALWQAGANELDISFTVDAEIDGTPRRAEGVRRSSRGQGVYETTVAIDGTDPHGLIWSRDGIWTGTVEAGETVWTASTPELLGFDSASVDAFLSNPDRLHLAPLHDLLGLEPSLARLEQGNRPVEYELEFYTFGLEPGDTHFDAIAGILKSEIAELIGGGGSVDFIEIYSTKLTIASSDTAQGVFLSLVTEAEFGTSAGYVRLTAVRTNRNPDGAPLEFSLP